MQITLMFSFSSRSVTMLPTPRLAGIYVGETLRRDLIGDSTMPFPWSRVSSGAVGAGAGFACRTKQRALSIGMLYTILLVDRIGANQLPVRGRTGRQNIAGNITLHPERRLMPGFRKPSALTNPFGQRIPNSKHWVACGG